MANLFMVAPIVLFVFNRLEHTRQTLGSLKRNDLAGESELFVFSDGPEKEEDRKKIEEVRRLVENITGFKKIHLIKREKNYGLAKNIINGVTEVIQNYDKAIVLEDDLVCAPSFLNYMNWLLLHFEQFKKDRKQKKELKTGFS